jgi:hypothetical protein
MMMNESFAHLAKVAVPRVQELAAKAGTQTHLPQPVVQGFDGESWVWLWRTYMQDEPPRTAEVRLRARPDEFADGLELEVSASAWLEESPGIAWSRVFASRFLELSQIEADDFPSEFVHAFASLLHQAHRGAIDAVRRLDEIAERRDGTIERLRARGAIVDLRSPR